MENICLEHGYFEWYMKMANAQDSIGWRRFMEGMVSKEMRNIQRTHASISGMWHNTKRWGVELVTCLLEVTHGQWLYCNVQVHDRITGTLATQRKEELQMEMNDSESWGRKGSWRKIAI